MKTITVLLLLLFSLQAFSQLWFENDPVWVHRFSGFGYLGYQELKVENDTIINGQVCKKIRSNLTGIDIYTPLDTFTVISYEYAYEEGEKVYIFSFVDSSFHLAYDFGMDINDTLKIQVAGSDEKYLVLTEKGVQELNGKILRYQKIKSQTGNILVIFNGIGFLYSESSSSEPFFSGRFNIIDAFDCIFSDPTPYLKCFRNNTFEFNPLGIDCYGLGQFNSTQEFQAETLIEVFPIPFNTQLKYNNRSKLDIFNINLYNSNGIKVISTNKINGNINVQTLLPGLYYVEFLMENGARHIHRAVK